MSASSKKKLRKEQAAAELTEKQLNEQKEAKKLKTMSVTFIVVMALVVCIAVGTMIGTAFSNSGIIEKNTLAVTIDDHELNTVELNYFYIDAITGAYNEWYQTYGDYTTMYLPLLGGPDLTQPLSSSIFDQETGETWADYFIELAISNARATYALADAATAEGHVLSQEDIEAIDDHMANMANLYAVGAGYSSLNDYLRASYGPGSNEENFRAYCELTSLASSYQSAKIESLTYDEDDLRAYDTEHTVELNSYNYTSYYITASKYLTGGTVGEDGTTTYSDEETAASVAAAKAAAESLLGSADVLLFDKAVGNLEVNGEPTGDEATKSENVLYSSVNSLFQEWISAEDRKEGDMEIFVNETTTTAEDGTETTTVYGYYVVFFESVNDNTNFYPSNVRHILVAFEGGTTDESGVTTYSEEEKQAARDEADAILAEYLAGDTTEESFGSLAIRNSDDSGSYATGGLIENVLPDNTYVENFQNWAVAEHEVGDTGIIETEYGCHIMYYVGHGEQNYRDHMIEEQLRSDDYSAWYTELVDAKTVTEGDTSKLDKDLVLLATA